ncbi:MAG: DUF3987 domain-containing protein [Verrucomicrobiota bacterium]
MNEFHEQPGAEASNETTEQTPPTARSDRNKPYRKIEPEKLDAEASHLTANPPKLPDAALYGVAGEIVRKLDPYTEADQAALLFEFLACFGSVIGRTAHFPIEATRHHSNLFAVIVGQSAKARKGTSWDRIHSIFQEVDPDWASNRVKGGCSSGEGILAQVQDDRFDKDGEVIEGIKDKRLALVEPEFALVLRVLKRDCNTLSSVLRNLWDGKTLETLVKNNPMKATGAHGSIVGQITVEELKKEIRDTAEMFNGFANRFLWVYATRSKMLPRSAPIPAGYLSAEVQRIAEAVAFAKRQGAIWRDEAAEALWATVYTGVLAYEPTGLLGGVVSRSEAQVVRLSLIFALLDCSDEIRVCHLWAALACWQYCGESAQFIFGEAQADPMSRKVLDALRGKPEGLTRTQIQKDAFNNNCPAEKLNATLKALEQAGQARREQRQGQRGEVDHWFLASPFKMHEFNEHCG